MFKGAQEKSENFFDRLDDLLEKRNLFHQRLNHHEKGEVFRTYLHQIFDQKIKEKRLGGARLQAKATKVLAIVCLAFLVYGLVMRHKITVIGCLIAVAYAVWTHVSALKKLLPPLEEADREARDKTNQHFQLPAPLAPQPSTTTPATPPSPPTREELIRLAVQQARQRQHRPTS